MSKPHTVIVVFDAKHEKEAELAALLETVVKPSRAENACLEYRLHKSIENPGQFVLYENWKSKEEHQEQFTKPYILTFAEKLNNLLAKPFQVIIAEEVCTT